MSINTQGCLILVESLFVSVFIGMTDLWERWHSGRRILLLWGGSCVGGRVMVIFIQIGLNFIGVVCWLRWILGIFSFTVDTGWIIHGDLGP